MPFSMTENGRGHMDESGPSVRFAIVRLRSAIGQVQLRLLLERYGYEEPIWLDAGGRPVSPPAISASHVSEPEERATQTTPQHLANQTTPVASRQFLTLPTVLTESPGLSQASNRRTSIALPLAPAGSSQSTVLSCSSVLSAAHGSSSSTRTLSPSPSQDASHQLPVVSAEMRPELGESSGGGLVVEPEAWVSQTPLRPRGKKPNPPEDPNIYYTCALCKNTILGTRVSNLQNHVRRHATIKQFQCRYCDYSHNEIAKVRLHMTNNHNDSESQPVNNLTSDMQSVWRALFRQCFPTRAQRRRGIRQNPGPSGVQQPHNSSASTSRKTSTSTVRSSHSGTQPPLSLRRRRLSLSSSSNTNLRNLKRVRNVKKFRRNDNTKTNRGRQNVDDWIPRGDDDVKIKIYSKIREKRGQFFHNALITVTAISIFVFNGSIMP